MQFEKRDDEDALWERARLLCAEGKKMEALEIYRTLSKKNTLAVTLPAPQSWKSRKIPKTMRKFIPSCDEELEPEIQKRL